MKCHQYIYKLINHNYKENNLESSTLPRILFWTTDEIQENDLTIILFIIESFLILAFIFTSKEHKP